MGQGLRVGGEEGGVGGLEGVRGRGKTHVSQLFLQGLQHGLLASHALELLFIIAGEPELEQADLGGVGLLVVWELGDQSAQSQDRLEQVICLL